MFAHRLHVLVSLMLVIAILMPETEYAQSAIYQYRQKRQALEEVGRYCGSNLSSKLQKTCGSVYNSRFKKSNQEVDMDYYAISNVHPYKSIENARKMLRFRRFRSLSQGIHEECCLKSCSTEEMRSYCG